MGSFSVAPVKCATEAQALVDKWLPQAMDNTRKAIDEIKAVMVEQGYKSDDYRIVLQSATAVAPRGSENRYPETGKSRLPVDLGGTGGCPMWNSDLDWYRDTAIPSFANNMRKIATEKGIDFLDLSDMMQGREICSKSTSQVTATNPPSPLTSEWARFITPGFFQGQYRESFHTNFYGQQATGTCLTKVFEAGPGHFTCKNIPGKDWREMNVTRL
jgi:hypothetical protein